MKENKQYVYRKANYAPPGMFEFSKPMDKKEELDVWVDHFSGKGIATKIVEDANGRYVLCREGIEATGNRW